MNIASIIGLSIDPFLAITMLLNNKFDVLSFLEKLASALSQIRALTLVPSFTQSSLLLEKNSAQILHLKFGSLIYSMLSLQIIMPLRTQRLSQRSSLLTEISLTEGIQKIEDFVKKLLDQGQLLAANSKHQ